MRPQSLWKEKTAKAINCHHSDVLWNSKRALLVKFSHKDFPSFQPTFNFRQRMLIFRNKPGSRRKILSCLPLAKYLDFYDVSKNSEHINTFRGARLKSHPLKFRSFNFLRTKESQRPKRKSFQALSIMANKIFYPTSYGKKIIWSNLFKPFKDTISKTNTCFRQHHDLEPKHFEKPR